MVLNDLASLTERIRLLQEEIGAKQMEQNNRTLYTLTVITVLALPINLVASLLGMNVPGLPLQQHGQAFLEVVIALTCVTGVLAYLLFINRRD